MSQLKKKSIKKCFVEEEVIIKGEHALNIKENINILKDIQNLLNSKTYIATESTGDEASSNNSLNFTTQVAN